MQLVRTLWSEKVMNYTELVIKYSSVLIDDISSFSSDYQPMGLYTSNKMYWCMYKISIDLFL